MTLKIDIVDSPGGLRGEAKSRSREEWFDTSYQDAPSAIGALRMPRVQNGNYDRKHPVLDAEGNNIGFLIDGVSTLCYTYCCVYVDRADCFYISHALRGRSSYISAVSDTGHFFFGGRKFESTWGTEVPWVDREVAFKLVNDQQQLLFLAGQGFCFIDTVKRSVISKTTFDGLHGLSGFALSPKVNVLALCFSTIDHVDPLDGQDRYRNLLCLYNLDTGKPVGQRQIGTDQQASWKVAFGPDGRQLSVRSETTERAFDLQVRG